MSRLIEDQAQGQGQDQAREQDQEQGLPGRSLHVMVMATGHGAGYTRLAHWLMSDPPVLVPDDVMDPKLAGALVARLHKHLQRGEVASA